MSIEFAVDRLYECGYVPAAGTLVHRLEDGRKYPATADVVREFAGLGLTLTTKYVALFNCYRAEWRASEGEGGAMPAGYCVGTSEAEAVVYALARLLAHRAEVGVTGGVA